VESAVDRKAQAAVAHPAARSRPGAGVPGGPSGVLYSTAMFRTGSIILS
jgi:hypothetical protein